MAKNDRRVGEQIDRAAQQDSLQAENTLTLLVQRKTTSSIPSFQNRKSLIQGFLFASYVFPMWSLMNQGLLYDLMVLFKKISASMIFLAIRFQSSCSKTRCFLPSMQKPKKIHTFLCMFTMLTHPETQEALKELETRRALIKILGPIPNAEF